MKTRKNLMVLVLLSLFLSVGVADDVNLDDINLEELETLMGEDNSSSTEYEYEDDFNQATYDEFVKAEERMAKIKAETVEIKAETVEIKAETAEIKAETANIEKVTKALSEIVKAGEGL